MKTVRAAILAALYFLTCAMQAQAQDITLTSQDGAVEISGTLLGFDGEYYRVETDFGELTVDGSGVTCDGPGCPDLLAYVAEIAFSGSATMAQTLMPALIEGYALRNGLQAERVPQGKTEFDYVLRSGDGQTVLARFSFFVTNADEGFADLLANEADIVLSQRNIRPEENKRARALGLGDMTDLRRSRVLALDAFVPVVSPQNPVREISVLQLAQVFSGKITNWRDLGGPNAPIALHLPPTGSGLTQGFVDRVLKPGQQTLAETLNTHEQTTRLPQAVAADPFAIGIASFAAHRPGRMLTITGTCGFSLDAGRRTIKTEDYPLTAQMFFYMPARRLPKLARDFLRYTASPAAQIVIRRAGFVDQAPEEIPLDKQGNRLANALAAAGPETSLETLQSLLERVDGMQRLTTSFRFESGSSRLDAQSRSNVAQFAQSLESGAYDARKILLVGFSDGQGPAAANRNIALARAKTVLKSIRETAETADFSRLDIDVAAYGEAMPMACDDTSWGRQVNRRVEIWVQ